MLQWIEGIAFALGLGFAALLTILPRFGPESRRLLLLILPVCISAGTQAFGPEILNWTAQDLSRLSMACIIIAAAGGYVATSIFTRDTGKRCVIISVCALSGLLVMALYLIPPPYAEELQTSKGYLALGPAGYVSGLFLLVISVVVLAILELGLRSIGEIARWRLKFLFLGIGTLYAALIYMSSQMLLFSPRSGLIPMGAIGLFHVMFLISCGLLIISWKRSSGKTQIAVSHGAIYSSITLLSVGVYLIASSLIARWASQWGDLGLPMEALIFLVSAVVLTAAILGTRFRHRTRAWIRRNIFAGRYDYRQFWLEAAERIRSIDPPQVMALALAGIVHKALGAIDVAVWTRRWNPNRLNLLGFIGNTQNSIEEGLPEVIEELLEISEPISVEDLNGKENGEALKGFMESTHASLLVPMLSSNRLVGVITVGSDRSGQPYDTESREFLRALAGHAAGEFHKSELLATLVETKEDEAFRAFSTFLLHDLKNFAATLSYIAQNAPKHQNNPEFQKDAFQSVYDTSEKMKRLCSSLRTFSSTLAADKKSTDLNQVVRAVADTLSAGINSALKLELNHVPRVMADEDELKRVLQNLMINACEAIQEDGDIIIRTRQREEKIELTVEDNGKGMSREFVEKELFQPFHTTKSGGLGIGLFQSKKIMEAHRGFIHVESEEGKGTKVSLIFPLSISQK